MTKVSLLSEELVLLARRSRRLEGLALMEILGMLIGVGLMILWLNYREVMNVVLTVTAMLMFIIGVIRAIP